MNQTSYLIISIALNIFFIASFFVSKDSQEKVDRDELQLFKKRGQFFTKNEREFFNVLKVSAENLGLIVFPKPRLADIFLATGRGEKRLRTLAKIQHRHVDYLLCDIKKFSPIIAIELDDSTHDTEKSKKKDKFKDELFAHAGVPLLRIKVTKSYNPELLKDAIWETVNK